MLIFGGAMCLFTIWPADQVQVEGELVTTSQKVTPFFMGYPEETDEPGLRVDTVQGNKSKLCLPLGGTIRKTCAKCHSYVLNDLSGGLVDVMAGVWDMQEGQFEPEIHINYETAIWKIKDGKPKFRNYPSIFGGDDETMEE